MKRRKVEIDGHDVFRSSSPRAVNGHSTPKPVQEINPFKESPRTLSKQVSPPPTKQREAAPVTNDKAASVKPGVEETLNPRLVPQDPAGHGKRTLYLTHLHAEQKRLNDEVASSTLDHKAALTLRDPELVKAALDEEEKTARDHPKVYTNIIKRAIAKYKKMKLEDWVAHVKATFSLSSESDKTVKKQEGFVIDTGLPLHQEHLILPWLETDQTHLAKHGYIPTPPSESAMEEAKAAVAQASNFEVCDRCKSRFQVFPDRRLEDGSLATNGPCVYHWGRQTRPKAQKTDAIQGTTEPVYSCCNELINSKGCAEAEFHVFKIGDPSRMAAVLPFMTTPENLEPWKGPNGRSAAAVTFDCEMGYTAYGLELVRLTAVSWPENDLLVDVLVRPKGAILDLNSRFSGVWPESYTSATPYVAGALPRPQADDRTSLPLVSSIEDARDLLCSFLTPGTYLIGHALENDLNSVRLCHPKIIDTIVLYAHPKGLPYRFGLKMLTSRHLGRDIQTGGANGHDSLEDAQATGDLVRAKIGKRWPEMRREGWKIESGLLMPPLPPEIPPPPEGTDRVLGGGGAGVKRQRIQIEAKTTEMAGPQEDSDGPNKKSRRVE